MKENTQGKMHNKLFTILFLFLLTSCSSWYGSKDFYGADEFVLDSYQIDQGLASILRMQGKSVEEIPKEFFEKFPDTIHENDRLGISLYLSKRTVHSATLDDFLPHEGFLVQNGKIYLPDIGTIAVVGLTLSEASDAIAKACQKEMGSVEVSVLFKEKAARKVIIAGMVNSQNVLADGKLRLLDALCSVKIPPDANLFCSYFKRKDRFIPIDFYKLLKEGDLSQNIVLQEGDLIYIAETSSSSVWVVGAVGSGKKVFVPSGKISIKEALTEAGGITPSADRCFIQVIRGGVKEPKIYLLSWDEIVHLPNESALLMTGDMVYVETIPFARWKSSCIPLFPPMTPYDRFSQCEKQLEVILR